MKPSDRLDTFGRAFNLRVVDAAKAARGSDRGVEFIIPGKHGEIADMGDPDGSLRLRVLAVPRTAIQTGALRNRFKESEAGGLRLKVRAGDESVWNFDPKNDAEARLAIKIVGARRRRIVMLTLEQRQAIGARLHRKAA